MNKFKVSLASAGDDFCTAYMFIYICVTHTHTDEFDDYLLIAVDDDR
jgi:hypothetical protein